VVAPGRSPGTRRTVRWGAPLPSSEGCEELEDERGDGGGTLLLGPVPAAVEDREDAEVGDEVGQARRGANE
jgi:hypothetical protein